MHDEDLWGLVPALTFAQGKPAPEVKCSYLAVVKNGKWTAPDGLRATLCKP